MIFSGELSYEWEVQKVLFFVFSDTVSTPASTKVPEVCSSVTTTYLEVHVYISEDLVSKYAILTLKLYCEFSFFTTI